MIDLKTQYRDKLKGELQKSLSLKNPMQVPEVKKVILSLGTKAGEKDALKAVAEDLKNIAGQNPVITKAKKSISNFKLREGMDIGAKVTLRGDRMYDFLYRLINAALPRIRDFRGLSPTAFDGKGNYNLGVDDQTIFPEIDPDGVKYLHGLNITIVTSTKSDDHALALLKCLGMPIAEKKQGKEEDIG